MKSFKWKGIPVNIPDSRPQWILLVLLPVTAAVVVNLLVLIFRLAK